MINFTFSFKKLDKSSVINSSTYLKVARLVLEQYQAEVRINHMIDDSMNGYKEGLDECKQIMNRLGAL